MPLPPLTASLRVNDMGPDPRKSGRRQSQYHLAEEVVRPGGTPLSSMGNMSFPVYSVCSKSLGAEDWLHRIASDDSHDGLGLLSFGSGP